MRAAECSKSCSVSNFVAAFSDGNGIDEKEIEELQSLIDELKG